MSTEDIKLDSLLLNFSKLVNLFVEQLKKMECDEIVLETESCNIAALKFYESNIN